MHLEGQLIRLRPRNLWASTDLGVLLLRRAWPAVMAAWCRTVLPLLLVFVALSWWLPLLSLFLIWWLKPLWERTVLYVLSRTLFGETPRAQAVASARLWRGSVHTALLWHRLSPTRSLLAPVTVLEQLSGPHAHRRRKVLSSPAVVTAAAGVTGAGLVLELAVLSGVLGGLYAFLPYDVPNLLHTGIPSMIGPLLVACYAVTLSLTEPLYVACGFGLYLNARVQREGWDIELSFRRLAARLQAGGMLLLVMLVAHPALAAEDGPDPQATISAVLEEPEFGHREVQRRVRLRPALQAWLDGDRAPASGDAEWAGESIRLVLLGSLIVALAALGVGGYRRSAWQGASQVHRRALPAARGHPPVEAAPALPADVPAAARARLTAADRRGALSLLYRGAIAVLNDVHHAEIRTGATESECVQCARRCLPPAGGEYMHALTQAWAAVAYGPHQAVDIDALIDAWPAHFGAAS